MDPRPTRLNIKGATYLRALPRKKGIPTLEKPSNRVSLGQAVGQTVRFCSGQVFSHFYGACPACDRQLYPNHGVVFGSGERAVPFACSVLFGGLSRPPALSSRVQLTVVDCTIVRSGSSRLHP